MITKLTIAAAAILAVTPAAVSAFMPSIGPVTSLRSVGLATPVTGFTQTEDRIQVRLSPASGDGEKLTRTRVVIRDTDGDVLTIPLEPGQIWASALLPANLASADTLAISVN